MNESTANYSKFINDSGVSTSYSQIKKKKTLKDYEFIVNEKCRLKSSELGKGAFGTVKKVRDIETGKIYAMKMMNKRAVHAYSAKENLRREISIQKKMSHPHIIRLHNCFEDNENVCLVLELAENGSLFHYLRRRKSLEENEAFVFFFQACLGIDYLHKKKVIHRDLKPENLLLDSEGNIKLCDFGWSTDMHNTGQSYCGTIDYMAPEMVKNLPHDQRVDIWCLGVLLYEMLHGRAPFSGRNDHEKTQNISANARIHYNNTLSPEAIHLMQNILKPYPEDRMSLLGIFNHPWMKKNEKIFKINIMSYVAQYDQLKEAQTLNSDRSRKENNENENLIKPQSRKNSPVKRNPTPLRNFDENLMIRNVQSDVKKSCNENRGDWSAAVQSASKAQLTSHFSLDQKFNSVISDSFSLREDSQVIRQIDFQFDSAFGKELKPVDSAESSQIGLNNSKTGSTMIFNSVIEEESLDHFIQRICSQNEKARQLESSYKFIPKDLTYTNPFLNSNPSTPKNSTLFFEKSGLKKKVKKQVEIPERKSEDEKGEELGFFEELLLRIGCISRKDAKTPNQSGKTKKSKKTPFCLS